MRALLPQRRRDQRERPHRGTAQALGFPEFCYAGGGFTLRGWAPQGETCHIARPGNWAPDVRARLERDAVFEPFDDHPRSCNGQASGTGRRTWRERGAGRRMITKVWAWALYVGSLKDAAQLASANPMKIAAVLSLCPEQIEQRSPSIHYMRLPIADAQPISARQFEEIMAAIERGLQRGGLLVHCVAGYSRSPILAAAWMDRRGSLGFEAALREIAEIRTIDPSPVLLKSIKEHLDR